MYALWPDVTPAGGYITYPPQQTLLASRPRRVAVIGSTGSIGCNTLKVAEILGDSVQIVSLACGKNIRLLAEQALRWRPKMLAVLTNELAKELRALLPTEYKPYIVWGQKGYAELAGSPETDWVVCAQVGIAGLAATFAAAIHGKAIALANKESLVAGGALLRYLCRKYNASILPIDSEHYALFQCLAGKPKNSIKKLILTASGGPFLGKELSELHDATAPDALQHPTWRMGPKISIDSATLMNKGLELIEAMHLYGLPAQKIDILIQPQSIVHSLAEFEDNSLLAQLASPDMCLPIAACLSWPHIAPPIAPPLNLARIGSLTFMDPDQETFQCLKLALKIADAIRMLDTSEPDTGSIILNAANEAAVELFLANRCVFGQIPQLIDATFETCKRWQYKLEDLREDDPVELANSIEKLDLDVRKVARELIQKKGRE